MSVLVKGMEMPIKKNGAVLIIYPDGKCAFENGKTYQAVPVPPHGRLIDADAVLRRYDYESMIWKKPREEMPGSAVQDDESTMFDL